MEPKWLGMGEYVIFRTLELKFLGRSHYKKLSGDESTPTEGCRRRETPESKGPDRGTYPYTNSSICRRNEYPYRQTENRIETPSSRCEDTGGRPILGKIRRVRDLRWLRFQQESFHNIRAPRDSNGNRKA